MRKGIAGLACMVGLVLCVQQASAQRIKAPATPHIDVRPLPDVRIPDRVPDINRTPEVQVQPRRLDEDSRPEVHPHGGHSGGGGGEQRRREEEEVTMYWPVINLYGGTLFIRFVEQGAGREWPGGGNFYNMNYNQGWTAELRCRRGRQICYGAVAGWNAGAANWGVGRHGNLACSSCCHFCRPGTVQQTRLGR